MIRSEAAGRNHAVDVRVKLQALIPAVEHAEEADLGAEVARIAGDFKQGLSAGVEEQGVDEPLVLQGERSQFARQGEDGMDIASGQQFPLARLEPASARVALAAWAMSVATRVVGDGGRMSAAGAAIAMAAQSGGAATHDGGQHLLVLPADPLAAAVDEALPCVANDVGHLQERPTHALCWCAPWEENVSASSGLAVALRWRWDRCR